MGTSVARSPLQELRAYEGQKTTAQEAIQTRALRAVPRPHAGKKSVADLCRPLEEPRHV